MIKSKIYTPIKVSESSHGQDWQFILHLRVCASCGKSMMHPVAKKAKEMFHLYHQESLKGQMDAAGIVWQSHHVIGDEPICEECAAAGKASFRCEFCSEMRPSDLLHDEYPMVCKVCYETLTAKEWDEKHEAFSREHRYDYE